MDWAGLPQLGSRISPYISAIKGTPGVQSSRAVSERMNHAALCYSLTDESGLGGCHGNQVPGLVEIVFQGRPFRSSEENPTTEMASLVSRTRNWQSKARSLNLAQLNGSWRKLL